MRARRGSWGTMSHDHDVIRDATRSRNGEIALVAMQSRIGDTVGLFGDALDVTA